MKVQGPKSSFEECEFFYQLDTRQGAAEEATEVSYSCILLSAFATVRNRIQGKMVQFCSSLCSSLDLFWQLLPCSIYESTNMVYKPSWKYSLVILKEHTIQRCENSFLFLCRGTLCIDEAFLWFLHLHTGTWSNYTWLPSVVEAGLV